MGLVFGFDREAFVPPFKVHAHFALILLDPERRIQYQPEQEDSQQNANQGGFGNTAGDGRCLLSLKDWSNGGVLSTGKAVGMWLVISG